MWIVGVDGGGTKTTVAAASPDLTRIEQAAVGPTNVHLVGLEGAQRELTAGLREALARIGGDPGTVAAAAFGVAGLDHPDQIAAYTAMARGLLPGVEPARLRVVNDVIVAYHSGTRAEAGVAIIAGTGSHAYGRAADGREAFAGGLDWRLSDEGSGYAIGDAVLHAAARAADGRGPATRLRDLVLAALGARTVRDLVLVVYQPGFGKAQVAALAPLCDEAAAEGDVVARDILHAAASDLARHVLAVAVGLGFERAAFPVVLIGSVFQSAPVRGRFEAEVRGAYPRAEFVTPSHPPVVGALRLAASLLEDRDSGLGTRDS